MSDDRQSCLRKTATTEEMLSALYMDLRRLAAAKMRHEGRGHTLQATALVHEAFLRLSRSESVWESKGHFFAAADKTEGVRHFFGRLEKAWCVGDIARSGDTAITH